MMMPYSIYSVMKKGAEAPSFRLTKSDNLDVVNSELAIIDV